MPVTFETIAANRQLVEHLADLSDVQLGAGSSEPAIYTVEGAGDIQVIGRDSTGGQFALSQATGQVFSGQAFSARCSISRPKGRPVSWRRTSPPSSASSSRCRSGGMF